MEKLLSAFRLRGRPLRWSRYGEGHINQTWLVETDERRYILQRLSRAAFADIPGLMENVAAVTAYLAAQSTDPRACLHLIPTVDGGCWVRDAEGETWRMYDFIEDSLCLQAAESPEDFYQSAVAFGSFQRMLRDFPADTLHETIPDFHNTPDRYRKFDAVLRADPLGCKRILAYIPDDPALYEYMTGIKFLNFVSDIYDIDSDTRTARIKKYANLFELTGDLAQPISAYSHGMKQKLAIISAWIHDPKLIIMDEPFVGLDPKASHILKGMMREKCNEGGAIFFSTHVLEVAEKLCDKVAIIKEGKLQTAGTMEEVKGNESLESVFLELVE